MFSVREVIGRIRRCSSQLRSIGHWEYEKQNQKPDIHQRFSTHQSVKLDGSDIDGLELAGIDYLSVLVVGAASIGDEVERSSQNCSCCRKNDERSAIFKDVRRCNLQSIGRDQPIGKTHLSAPITF